MSLITGSFSVCPFPVVTKLPAESFPFGRARHRVWLVDPGIKLNLVDGRLYFSMVE